MTHVAVGVGRNDGDTKDRVVLTASATTLYLGPDMAERLATDLLIQADRLRKQEVWKTLKE